MSIARVVKVSDKYTVVVNKGAADGVSLGDKYLIYGLGEELLDPETSESLGKLEIVRGAARVVHLQERLSTLESYETVRHPGSKKIIKREGRGVLASVYPHMGPSTEEIEEGPTTEIVQLKNPETGDYAKPI